MLTLIDVAQIFDVPPSIIIEWCEEGKLRYYSKDSYKSPVFTNDDVAVAYLDRSIQKSIDQ